tara:strand:+ start:110 stop:670 length:561 start_codon:yes stop_codon:yes gene_type:complete
MIKQIRKTISMHDYSNINLGPNLIKASILILLFQDKNRKLHTILQKRSQNVHHPGEIGFPGGRFEEADGDLATTALRETNEEIGIDVSDIEIIGNLHPTTTRMGYSMHTYVGYTKQKELKFKLRKSEVEKLIIIPVTHLLNPNNHLQVTWQGQSRLLWGNGFRVDNEIIFGATARVVDEFITLIQR